MKLLYKLLFFFILLNQFLFSYINIYPLSFDKRIDGMGAIRDFTLTNTTNETLRYQIKIEKTDFKDDMSKWAEIYPAVLTLKPGQKGEIKMYIRAPKDAVVGEYKMVLNIKEMEVPKLDRKDRKKLSVYTNLKINLYGYVGKLDSSISLSDLKLDKDRLKLKGKIKNTSLRRVNLEVMLSDSKEKEQILLAELKLRKSEEKDLSEIEIYPINKNGNLSKMNSIVIYEKAVGKVLKKIRI